MRTRNYFKIKRYPIHDDENGTILLSLLANDGIIPHGISKYYPLPERGFGIIRINYREEPACVANFDIHRLKTAIDRYSQDNVHYKFDEMDLTKWLFDKYKHQSKTNDICIPVNDMVNNGLLHYEILDSYENPYCTIKPQSVESINLLKSSLSCIGLPSIEQTMDNIFEYYLNNYNIKMYK